MCVCVCVFTNEVISILADLRAGENHYREVLLHDTTIGLMTNEIQLHFVVFFN